MTNEHLTWVGILTLGSALLGWIAHGFRAGSRWGAAEAHLKGVQAQLSEFKGAFQAHLEQDKERDVRLDGKLSAIARDLNQLIGAQQRQRNLP